MYSSCKNQFRFSSPIIAHKNRLVNIQFQIFKSKNENKKSKSKNRNRISKSKNENQICKTLFTYTHTHTLDRLSSCQEICCHQLPNCIIYYIKNKANTYTLTYTHTISYTYSATFAYTYTISCTLTASYHVQISCNCR